MQSETKSDDSLGLKRAFNYQLLPELCDFKDSEGKKLNKHKLVICKE